MRRALPAKNLIWTVSALLSRCITCILSSSGRTPRTRDENDSRRWFMFRRRNPRSIDRSTSRLLLERQRERDVRCVSRVFTRLYSRSFRFTFSWFLLSYGNSGLCALQSAVDVLFTEVLSLTDSPVITWTYHFCTIEPQFSQKIFKNLLVPPK